MMAEVTRGAILRGLALPRCNWGIYSNASRQVNLLGYNGYTTTTPSTKEVHAMKSSRQEVRWKAHATPEVKFESQSLTSFAGLVLLQRFFALLGLKGRLAGAFAHVTSGKVFA